MNKQTENALRMAIEYLREYHNEMYANGFQGGYRCIEIIDACKAALESKESESVCKYGQVKTECYKMPMDCQCMLDVTFENQESEQELAMSSEVTKAFDFLNAVPNGYSLQPIDQQRFEKAVEVLYRHITLLYGICADYSNNAVKDGEQKIKQVEAIRRLLWK